MRDSLNEASRVTVNACGPGAGQFALALNSSLSFSMIWEPEYVASQHSGESTFTNCAVTGSARPSVGSGRFVPLPFTRILARFESLAFRITLRMPDCVPAGSVYLKRSPLAAHLSGSAPTVADATNPALVPA